MPRDEEGRVRDRVGADPHMPLLDELGRRADRLRHTHPAHHHREPPPTERGHGQLVLDVGEFGGCGEEAHVVELVEEGGFLAGPEGVLWGEEGEAVGVGAEGACELVVFVVVVAVLDVVASHDLDLAQIYVLLPLRGTCEGVKRIGRAKMGRTLRKSTFLSSFCSWCLNWRTMMHVEDEESFCSFCSALGLKKARD